MRKCYNIPLNDSAMDVSLSPQSNYMPSFLIGNNNQNDSLYMNHSKIAQNSMNSFTPFDNKPMKTIDLKSNASFNDSSRRNGPPITSLRNRSPKSYMKSSAFTNDTSMLQNGNFNQSNRSFKPYDPHMIKNNHNVSLRDSDIYTRYVNKSQEVNDKEFENWVTIFGYPPNEARNVLTYFAEIGCIKDQKISNTGNWMHLQYESKMHAVSALNRNGRIINYSVMIGVKPCDDKNVDVPFASRCNGRTPFGDTSQSPLPDNGLPDISTNDVFNRSMVNKLSMRSLTRPSNLSPIEQPNKPRPGMLSRAMSVLFRK